ncbi:MAG: hypothetical protein M3R65_03910 [Gemmatimonadota bacterium]|nr:hypothetical protein [Gemmatimonadota bacterium]
MAARPELVMVRDAVIRHLHHRASVKDVQHVVEQAGSSMKADSMTLEEILVVLKGAVTLAAEHVSHPSTPERVVWLRGLMVPWLISVYMNESGEFESSEEN